MFQVQTLSPNHCSHCYSIPSIHTTLSVQSSPSPSSYLRITMKPKCILLLLSRIVWYVCESRLLEWLMKILSLHSIFVHNVSLSNTIFWTSSIVVQSKRQAFPFLFSYCECNHHVPIYISACFIRVSALHVSSWDSSLHVSTRAIHFEIV